MSNPLTSISAALGLGASETQQVTGLKGAATPQGNAAAAAGAAAAVPAAYSSVQNALSGFYDVLTNGKMWRSLGWLILGALLMFLGIVLLVGPAAGRAAPLAAALA
jgi:hypothetical protein